MQLRQGERERHHTIFIGRKAFGQAGAFRIDALVHKAEDIAGEARKVADRGSDDLALKRLVGRRSAIEEPPFHRHVHRAGKAQRIGRCLQRVVYAFRLIVLHEEGLFGQRVAFGVQINPQRPGALLHTGRQGQVLKIAAQTAVIDHGTGIFDAIGADEDEGQRQIRLRISLGRAQQRLGVHRLTRAVNALVGPAEHIQRPGSRTALDATVGQIEGRLAQIEEGVVALLCFSNDQRRSPAATATRQAGRKTGKAVGIGDGLAQHLIVDGNEAHFHACHRFGIGERAQRGNHPFRARIGAEANFGDDEPLGGLAAPLVGLVELRLGRHGIDARLQLKTHVLQRDRRRHVLVQRAGRLHDAGPDLLAKLFLKLVAVIVGQLAHETLVAHHVHKAAVADAEDFQRHFLAVDGNNRDRRVLALRQHIGPAEEVDGRRAVADVKRQIGSLLQLFAIVGGHTGAQLHVIALAMAHTGDAKLRAFGGNRRTVAALHFHEVREIPVLFQLIGKDDADTRFGRIRVHPVIENAEAVVRDHLFIALCQGRIGRIEIARLAQAADRRLPLLRQGKGF